MKRLILIILMLFSAIGIGFGQHTRPSKDSIERLVFASNNNIDKLNKLLKKFIDAGDSSSTSITLYAIGRAYNQKSEYLLSIKAYKRAASIQKALGETQDEIQTMIGIATSCRRIGAYSSASDYLFYALNTLEKSDFLNTEKGKKQHSYILNGIGNIYKYLDNGQEAEKYFRKSLALDKELNNHVGMAMNWTTIGSVYEYRHQYDSAEIMYNRALEHNKQVRSKNGTGICHNRLGQLAYNKGDIEKAEKEFLLAYEVLKKAEDKWNLIKSATSLASIYIETGELKRGSLYLDEAEILVEGQKAFGHKNYIHNCRSILYKKQGNYRKAYEEAMKCIAYADSMSTQKDEQTITQNRIKFEQEQNQIAMGKLLLEKEKEVLEKRNTIIISSIIGFVLILILALLYRYGKLQERHNKELRETNAVKNKFFSIISHDLKNPVLAQQKTLQLLVDNYENLPKNIVYEHCKELSKSSESLLDLLISLLDWSRIEVGKMKYEPIRMDLLSLVEEAVRPLQEQMQQKNIALNINVDKEIFVFSDINATKTTLRNIVGNAIKFSKPGGIIDISVAPYNNERYIVSIKDNGIGMDKAGTENLFKLNVQKSSLGTAGESGSGLGLIVCKELVEMGGGSIHVKSELGKGTEIGFTIKISV